MNRVRSVLMAVSALAVVALAGCFPMPSAVPQAPATSTPSEPDPSESGAPETSESTEPSESPSAEAAPVPEGAVTADVEDGRVWAFTVTSIEVVAADALDRPADAGQKLVVVHMDGTLVEGSEPDFYYDFTVQVVDAATGNRVGLSSASSFYAEDDLFGVGREASFVDGRAIFQVPVDFVLGDVRVVANETQEEFIFSPTIVE